MKRRTMRLSGTDSALPNASGYFGFCSLIKGIYSVQMDALEQKKDEPDIESLAGKVAQNMLLKNLSAMK